MGIVFHGNRIKIGGFIKNKSYYKQLIKEVEDMKKEFKSNYEDIYQWEFKKKFLAKYSPETQRVYTVLFGKISKFEEQYGKDLYDFNLDEIRQVLKSLKATTIRSLQDKKSTIEQYIDFAIANHKSEYKVNFAEGLNSKEKIDPLLDKEAVENMIFDKEEIMRMAMDTNNAQDGVILALLFDGLSHKNEFDELRELTIDRFNEDERTIRIDFHEDVNKEFNRVIPISDETAYLIKRAYQQEKYESITGENFRKYTIVKGENVIRGLRGKAKVKGQIINQRLLRLKELVGNEQLNAKNIFYSGQLHFAKELFYKENLPVDEALPIILKRFAVPDNPMSRHYLKARIERYL